MFLISLSLSLESASVIHFPQTSWAPPPHYLPCLALCFSLLQCLSLPVRSGKNTAEGRNGILWPEATRRHTDNGGTSFLSAPPWSGSVVVSGQQTQSARGFYGTLKVQDPYSLWVWSRPDEEGGVYGLMSVFEGNTVSRNPTCEWRLCTAHFWTFILHAFPHPNKKSKPLHQCTNFLHWSKNAWLICFTWQQQCWFSLNMLIYKY